MIFEIDDYYDCLILKPQSYVINNHDNHDNHDTTVR